MADGGLVIRFDAGSGGLVIAEVRAVAARFSLTDSEAAAMLIGFGVVAMTRDGLIGGRASVAMTREQMLEEVLALIGEVRRN